MYLCIVYMAGMEMEENGPGLSISLCGGEEVHQGG